MAERFYVADELRPGPVTLRGAEAHHLATVCRLRPGDAVYLFNGDGRQYHALVRQVGRRDVLLEVDAVEAPPRELGFRLEVAAPLPRGDRAQFLLEKLTELGATSFVPLCTARSVVLPRETRLDRLARHVIEASKQCGRNVLLRVAPAVTWEDHCRSRELPARRFLAHPGGEDRPAEILSGPAGDVALAVGPEGGFTDDELSQARGAGWRILDLGPRVLRVETAAVALAVLFGMGSERRGLSPPSRPPG